ncbi:unnamed protein product [Rotaria sp. Silwood2]|nr:unnamed protein product [Rotaria sp. Silwood2]CAF2935948.1 unnamed protein product [Rotaria sp. Silwood2]CAF3314422.1 unnamed protein product [Rotaria sp. Silwood2]CAF3902933.1 unnamed protein product [Rotaria sp. Silwood2]CAF3989659.1 unnamed protein product [Rotaria sp. Silwood2]
MSDWCKEFEQLLDDIIDKHGSRNVDDNPYTGSTVQEEIESIEEKEPFQEINGIVSLDDCMQCDVRFEQCRIEDSYDAIDEQETLEQQIQEQHEEEKLFEQSDDNDYHQPRFSVNQEELYTIEEEEEDLVETDIYSS